MSANKDHVEESGAIRPLQARIETVEPLIAARHDLETDSDDRTTRTADLDVCLAARQAFTEFAAYADGESAQALSPYISELKKTFKSALEAMSSSSYPNADDFRSSIKDKLMMIEEVEQGVDLVTLLKSRLDIVD